MDTMTLAELEQQRLAINAEIARLRAPAQVAAARALIQRWRQSADEYPQCQAGYAEATASAERYADALEKALDSAR